MHHVSVSHAKLKQKFSSEMKTFPAFFIKKAIQVYTKYTVFIVLYVSATFFHVGVGLNLNMFIRNVYLDFQELHF